MKHGTQPSAHFSNPLGIFAGGAAQPSDHRSVVAAFLIQESQITRRNFITTRSALLVGASVIHIAVADDKPERANMHMEENDLTYEQQMKKLAIPFRKDLPQLFVCGDSISVGYTPALKVKLLKQINVTHRRDLPELFPQMVRPLHAYTGRAPSLIEFARAVLNSADYKPSVLLLNCGLHDIAGGGAGNKAQQYEHDLETLIALADKHHVTLVWVQTTPKASGQRDNPRIAEFNKISARVLNKHDVPIIDLHTFTTKLIAGHGEAKVIRPDKVHFTPFASEAEGNYIAAELRTILKRKSP